MPSIRDIDVPPAIDTSRHDITREFFAPLLGMEGVGARTLRALSLVGELVYGAPVSIKDPARFSFAHGGKDGHPYPVDKKTYDTSIATLHSAIRHAKIGQREQVEALKRLTQWTDTELSPSSPNEFGV